MPVGNVSYYSRRKYSPQAPPDHQSRIFYEDYTRPEGGSERSRSNGSVSSSAASHQSSSSCVSVNSATSSTSVSSASAAADAVNANVLSVVGGRPSAGGWVLEREPNPVAGCIDSASVPSPGPATDCCVRASPLGGASASAVSVTSQQVSSVQASVGGFGTKGGSSSCGGGSVGSANIGVTGLQRRVQEVQPCAADGGGGIDDQANGPLLLCPPVVASSAARTQTRQSSPSTASGVPFTVASTVGSGPGQISSTLAPAGSNNNEELGLPLSPADGSGGTREIYEFTEWVPTVSVGRVG
ncbi:putative lysozyme-like protein [Anopheles coustani]|uniref:putative lysozyme-like protein n=1 Tax=Anopheles coustani TaxID=139045 RepID=UPI00265868BF|nr:putative lysozyme-like protein [Anopheles coustani]